MRTLNKEYGETMSTKKIRIKKETYERLLKKGRTGDSVDDIIKRILVRIDSIEARDVKDPRMGNSIMNLRTTKNPDGSLVEII